MYHIHLIAIKFRSHTHDHEYYKGSEMIPIAIFRRVGKLFFAPTFSHLDFSERLFCLVNSAGFLISGPDLGTLFSLI